MFFLIDRHKSLTDGNREQKILSWLTDCCSVDFSNVTRLQGGKSRSLDRRSFFSRCNRSISSDEVSLVFHRRLGPSLLESVEFDPFGRWTFSTNRGHIETIQRPRRLQVD